MIIWWLYDDYMMIIWWLYDDYMIIIWWLYDYYMMIIWWLYDDYMMIIWWLYDDYMMIIWWLYDDYMMIIWWLYDDYMMIIWWLYDDYMIIIWWLYDYYMIIIWWLYDDYMVIIWLLYVYHMVVSIVMGVPPVIIHFERWDYPWHKPSISGSPISGKPHLNMWENGCGHFPGHPCYCLESWAHVGASHSCCLKIPNSEYDWTILINCYINCIYIYIPATSTCAKFRHLSKEDKLSAP